MRIHPFLSLVSAAFVYGILCGMDPHSIITHITSGLGNIFSVLCIVIFAGVAIAEFLKRTKGIETVFMICAGTFIFSYVSDPYFWLVKGDSSMKEALLYYTLPLALAGAVVLACTILFL